MRLAYFTAMYPRATDTFIQNEVETLRCMGFEVLTYSIRRSGPEHDVSPRIVSEKRNTTNLIPANPFVLLWANLSCFLGSPIRYIRVLAFGLRTSAPGWRAHLYHLFYFQEALILARRLRRDRINHLHNHLGDVSGTVAMLASMLSGIPYSLTIHGPHIFFEPLRWALKEKVRTARFVVCISNFCRSQVMLYSNPADWHKLRIVHCGVDMSHFTFRPCRPSARMVLYVGRVATEKGLLILLQSVSALVQRDVDLELRILGDGPERPMLEATSSKLGLTNRVTFMGYTDAEGVRRELRSADVLVLPSFAEGVPVSLMEAMASGVPVIGTMVGGVGELITDGESGLLVPASDSVALARAIEKVLADGDLRQRLAGGAHTKILAEFDHDKEVAKLAECFSRSSSATAL